MCVPMFVCICTASCDCGPCIESINMSLLVISLDQQSLHSYRCSISLPQSFHNQAWICRCESRTVQREGWRNKIINKQELWGFSCHSNCCHLTSGGLWRAGMIDLPFSVLQLFTHQQQKFQLKRWSGGIFIATDTLEAHVSLQAWMSWWRRLGEERGGREVNESPVILAAHILSLFSVHCCHRPSLSHTLI